jgi:hypothetical protein
MSNLSSTTSTTAAAKHNAPPESVLLVPYPKIVFLYPTFAMALVAALVTAVTHGPLDSTNTTAAAVGFWFLAVFTLNLVILAFDFPRAASLTLVFAGTAIVLGLVLISTFYPGFFPAITSILAGFRPVANGSFYWSIVAVLGILFIVVLITVRFDYWEVRPNELLHHHGFLSNLERLSAPNLRMEKEIPDVFEYLLLQSGRLIIHTADDRRAIVLDNVPFIRRKEEAVTRMLGALQVQVRSDDSTT